MWVAAKPHDSPWLSRLAIACVIVGVGLLNVPDAGWAHALESSVCWLRCVAFAAIYYRRVNHAHIVPAVV